MINKEIIKFVGFDLDQTLYEDTAETYKVYRTTLYKLMAKELSISFKEAQEKFEKNYAILGSGTETVRLLGIQNPEDFSALVSKKSDIGKYLKKDQKLIDLIRYLQEQYTLFLITASAKESSLLKLKNLGLKEGDFAFRVYGDCEKSGKTKGRSFKKILKQTKAEPRSHIYVGDRDATDIIPAKNAGMQTIMVWNKSKHADLSLKTVYELKEYL
jgi:HAD superfamily hydrolase (TIGR01549 family)